MVSLVAVVRVVHVVAVVAVVAVVRGVANGKCETLRDGETSGFLCEPETF